jgi:hypothetical protein
MDRPAGPYAGHDTYGPVEHGTDSFDYWEYDCDDSSIHQWSENISWRSGGNTPTPSSDGLGMVNDELFAFVSDEQMRKWFAGHLRKMDRFGFVAAVYEVQDVQHGRRQSMFNWDTAQRVGDFSILRSKDIRAALDGGR